MKRHCLLSLLFILAFTSGLALPAAAQTQKLDAELQRIAAAGDTTARRVILTSVVGQFSAMKTFVIGRKKPVKREWASRNTLVTELLPDDLAVVASNSAVSRMSLDAPLRAHAAPLRGGAGLPYSLTEALGIGRSRFTGLKIGVAVIDSGIQRNAQFSKVVGGWDFLRDAAVKVNSIDPYGHGTHVTGLIAGNGKASPRGRYHGLAPGVRLIDLRVLDQNGAGYTSYVISAIEYAIANKASLGIDIINLSLGHPVYEAAATDPLVQAVERAVRAGIVVVVSAGNVGLDPATNLPTYGGITSPGNAPSVITVGATRTQQTNARSDDTVAEYSSRGPSWYDGFAKPDLVAPGHRDIATASPASTLATSYANLLVPDADGQLTYMALSGTSMATAVVSGAVALVLEASRARFPSAPRLTPNAVKAILQYSAIPLADADTLMQGTGTLNPLGAIDLATSLNPATKRGEWWLRAGVTETSLVDGTVCAWSRNIVWGDTLVLGDAVYYNDPAWASNVVWGDRANIVWGDRAYIVWGDNVVWGDSYAALWANSVVWGDDYNVGVTADRTNIVWGDVSGNSTAFTQSLSVAFATK